MIETFSEYKLFKKVRRKSINFFFKYNSSNLYLEKQFIKVNAKLKQNNNLRASL